MLNKFQWQLHPHISLLENIISQTSSTFSCYFQALWEFYHSNSVPVVTDNKITYGLFLFSLLEWETGKDEKITASQHHHLSTASQVPSLSYENI